MPNMAEKVSPLTTGGDASISPPPTKRRRKYSSPAVKEKSNEHLLSIYSWNINGIAPFLQPSITSFLQPSATNWTAKASLRDVLRRYDWPQILCLQEVKINPDDLTTQRAVDNAVKRQNHEPNDAPDYKPHFCLPSDKHNARGFGRKVYGVCNILRSDFSRFVERIRPVDWDKEGRFLIIETKGDDDSLPKLAIINIYAVNGTENPYRLPESGKVVGTRHDRKLEVHRLLQKEVRGLEAQGYGVIIAGDINIARANIDGFPNLRVHPPQHRLNRADFEARFLADGVAKFENEEDSLAMIDTFRHLHPQQNSYTYYSRTQKFGESCDRVDMILISRSLKDALVAAGMHETSADRGSSDHVPLYARFKFCID